jgi:hypothetical protein
LHRNTSQPRGDIDGQHASHPDGSKAGSSRGNDPQRRKKPREDWDDGDNTLPTRKDNSRNRPNRNGRDVSRNSESRPHNSGDSTDQYKIKPRGSHRKMIIGDSDSDSEPHPKRRLRRADDLGDATTNTQSDQSPPKAAQSKGVHPATNGGGVREDGSSKQRSLEKKMRQGKLVESKTSPATKSPSGSTWCSEQAESPRSSS